MTNHHVTSRREFLRGAATAGAATFIPLTKSLNGILNSSSASMIQDSGYPANKMSAGLPDIVNEITLHTPHVIKEIALGKPMQLWTYEGSSPGPILHVREGEPVNFTLINDSDMLHSVDFHAAQLPWDIYYQSIPPGESLSFTWTPNFPGVFMYHCGTPPVFVHLGNGMHGAIVVQPRDGWPEPAREYVLVQHELYLTAQPDANGVFYGDPAKILAVSPDYVVFNGYANQYQEEPLVANPNELIRIHVCNCGPTLWSAFHVIGALFEATFPDGNPVNRQVGMQTVTIPPGGGYTVELRIPDEGYYPFVTHSFAYTGLGALGLIKVGNPPDLGIVSH
jgi:nitrite reductase (NO-forming)